MRWTTIETLEQRRLLAGDWHNSLLPRDVDQSAHVAALDALLVIGELNRTGARQLVEPREVGVDPQVDVSGDDWLTPLDALLVINALNSLGPQQPQIVGGLTPESDPNGNSVVLTNLVTYQGQTLAGASVSVMRADDHSHLATAHADANGRFSFDLELAEGLQAYQLVARDDLGRTSQLQFELRLGNSIHDWNATALDVIRQWSTYSNDPYPNRIVTAQPPMVARNLAMIHIAMSDAASAVLGDGTFISGSHAAQPGASADAAVASAAFTVAKALYAQPDEVALWQASLDETLTHESDGSARDLGIAIGRDVAEALLASRSGDGASGKVIYQPQGEAGKWQRTFPDYLPALLPQWPQVRPFALTSGDEFRPVAPPDLGSVEYAEAVDEVMRRGAFEGAERGPEETEIALFWADGGGTSTPPGHWNQIAADVTLQRGTNLLETARTFALLNIAMADAGIASWDAKYAYDLWRPIDAIRQADADTNALTVGDSGWMPLLKTPPFPSYTSGHSTFSGAASTVLAALLGDQTSFSSRSDAHSAPEQRPLAPSQIVTRQFESFSQAAEEAGMSRVYGGIHFRFDHAAGTQLGRQVGQAVLDRLL